MKQYVSLPIVNLVSDVPVDMLHVKELADSIKSRGQLNPVIIREETPELLKEATSPSKGEVGLSFYHAVAKEAAVLESVNEASF